MRAFVTSDRPIRSRSILAVLVLAGAVAAIAGGSANAGSQAANGRIAYVSDAACRFDPTLKNEDIFSMAPDGSGKVDLDEERQPRRQPGLVGRRHEARVHAARQGRQRRRVRHELERQGAAERDQDVARRREPRLDSGRVEDHVRRQRDDGVLRQFGRDRHRAAHPRRLRGLLVADRQDRLHGDGRAFQRGDLRRQCRRQRRAERDERARLRRRLGRVVARRDEDCVRALLRRRRRDLRHERRRQRPDGPDEQPRERRSIRPGRPTARRSRSPRTAARPGTTRST